MQLGGKGANLAEMARIGLSVPPGFTVSTEACREYQQLGGMPPGLWDEILAALRCVERDMDGAALGDPRRPLLLSVRSGAAVSMPGMMDTVLNLGLNDDVVDGLAHRSGQRFAFDSYRRFLDMFGNVVRTSSVYTTCFYFLRNSFILLCPNKQIPILTVILSFFLLFFSTIFFFTCIPVSFFFHNTPGTNLLGLDVATLVGQSKEISPFVAASVLSLASFSLLSPPVAAPSHWPQRGASRQ